MLVRVEILNELKLKTRILSLLLLIIIIYNNDIGVNKNEIINEDVTLFLTLKHRDDPCGGNQSTMFHKRSRTVSFDLQKLKSELADISAQSNRKINNCTMM